MEKKPFILIDEEPLDVLYESPSVMVVNKQKGIEVHPNNRFERGTLLNRLFQNNRWLSEMETSVSAGVLHLFDKEDYGLMIFNKNDDYKEELTRALEKQEMSFSYFISVKGNEPIHLPETSDFQFTINNQKQVSDYTIIDMKVSSGNTEDIRNSLFPRINQTDINFYCYELELTLPHTGTKHTISLRDKSKEYPTITMFHAPPCSSCNEARNFISENGFIYESMNVLEEENGRKMLEINGGQKVIPTIIINEEIVTGFDRNHLKSLLGIL
jgi:23S rRNA-/tRNA-specific pseudouridylate synthase/glutaredoxin